MPLFRFGLLALLFWLLAASSSFAQPAGRAEIPVGTVKRLSGTALVERQGARLPAAVGMVLLREDRIVTGQPGAVGITLVDDTLLSIGSGTQLELSDVQFDTTTHGGRVWLRLIKGAMHMITGLVAREAPQNVRIETPTAVMGVRGTEFLIDTRDE
ncbi:MAG: FecR domain-containing protein [Rubrivivax sp.]|nr:FecR domain-containing protein [Rubrivivax sp.]